MNIFSKPIEMINELHKIWHNFKIRDHCTILNSSEELKSWSISRITKKTFEKMFSINSSKVCNDFDF
jgi:hypothetical protein